MSAEREWARNTEQFSNQTCLAFGLSTINFQFSIQLYWTCGFREWLSALTWGTTGALETCYTWTLGYWRGNPWSTWSMFFIHFLTPHPIFVSDPRETEVILLQSNNWKLRWSGIYCFHDVVWRLELGTWTIKDHSLLFCCCCCCAIVFVTVSWNSLVPHYRALID